MAISETTLSTHNNYGLRLTAPDLFVDVLTLDLSTGDCTSAYFPAKVLEDLKRGALNIFQIVPYAERSAGAVNLLSRLLTITVADDATLTLSAVVVGDAATLRASVNAAPASLLLHVPYSSTGGLAFSVGSEASGGGGGGVNAVTATAPIASSGGAAPNISLNASGVAAGGYGSATSVPVITITAEGLISNAVDTPIAFPAPTVTLQDAYDDSGSPAAILLANGKNLDVSPAGGALTAISLDASAPSNFTVDDADLTLSTTTSGAVNLISADDLAGFAGGATYFNGNGTINIGNGSANQAINIGTGGTRTITVGTLANPTTASVFGGSNVSINSNGTFTVLGGANSSIGTTAGDISISADIGDVTVYANGTELGLYANTAGTVVNIDTVDGVINMGVAAVNQDINIGTAGTRTIEIGSASGTVSISGAYTLPTADGNNGDVLTTNGAGVASWAPAGGGGLTYWTESEASAGINAARPVDAFTVANAGADVDAAIVAKGSGATLALIPDGTATAGNKRGQWATDWQKVLGNAATVASGDYSTVSGGSGNTASTDYATVVGGANNTASGVGSIAGGVLSIASGTRAIALGQGAQATGNYAFAVRGIASNTYAVALGGTASGDTSFSFNGTVSGNNSVAFIGTATGLNSSSIGGVSNTAAGDYSATLAGYALTAASQSEVVVGQFAYNFAGNPTSFVSTDAAFIYGNGTGAGPTPTSNALTLLKDGSLGLGLVQSKPADRLHLDGNARMTGAIIQAGFTSGAAINAGEVCYLATDGKVYPAQSDVVTTSSVVGVAVETVGGANAAIALATFNKTGGFAALTTGTEYFLSATTPGAVVDFTTLSGTSGAQIVAIGYARSATEIQVNIQQRGTVP